MTTFFQLILSRCIGNNGRFVINSIALSPQIIKVHVPAPVGEQSGLARVAGTAAANMATRYLMKAMFGDLKAGDEMPRERK